jgi:GR25 family glycosyltransferase involved in LPS biosynthesis
MALLRTRCLVRALARKLLELAALQEGGGSFRQLAFCAARYLLLGDDQPAAVRADLLDQVLRGLRAVYQQDSEHAHVPRDLLRLTSHTLSTRAVGHVINLDRRSDRWHRMLKMARKAHLLLYRHAAVDGSKGDRGISERDVALSWDSFVNAKFDEKCVASTSVTMSPSERACAASHLQLWRDFDSGKLCGLQAGRFDSPIMLVFEDDAKVKTENLAERVADILTELPSNFDICYLGCIVPSNAKRIKWSSQLLVPEYAWQLHAYLLSRAGARKLLNQLPISAPVDNFVAELAMTGMLHAFAVKQSLVAQHKVVSQQAARGSIDTDIRHSGRIVGAGVFS